MLSTRSHQLFAEAEQSADPILNATRDATEVTCSAQLYYVLVMLSTNTALDKCDNAQSTGVETWWKFTIERKPNLMSQSVEVLPNILSFHTDCDISAKLFSFERLVRDCEVQSQNAVDADPKKGVVILGMHDSSVKEHLIRNTARPDS